jgi:hypothetical protein
MTTELRSIPCPVLSTMGRLSGEGVPPRVLADWLESLVRSVPATGITSLVVVGTEHLQAQYVHTLTPAEVRDREFDRQAKAIAQALKELEGVTGPTAEKLRTLLGGA